ncbi:hypothetical protein [Streptomyces sp. NPDC046805]|uniref:hypothetical protein n=1 Tax=Streptomyces sp. NPDC046805 TaxID=3155134 RepID=UPI00340358B3
MDREGDDPDRDTYDIYDAHGTDGQGPAGNRLTQLLGDLLIELGQKVRKAGPEAVRILTDEEVQRANLRWYRTGWEEHAQAIRPAAESPDPAEPTAPPGPSEHPADPDPLSAAGRLLDFPRPDTNAPTHPLPIVGAGDSRVRELMPHRRRARENGGEHARGRDEDADTVRGPEDGG